MRHEKMVISGRLSGKSVLKMWPLDRDLDELRGGAMQISGEEY